MDRIVANVNGEIILLSDVRSQMALMRSFAAQGGPVPAEKLNEADTLKLMIDEKIIAHYAKENNVVIKESEVDQTIERIKGENRITSEFLEEALGRQGMTMEKYREKLKSQMAIQRITGMEISGSQVSDDEVRGYYRRRSGEFLEPGRVRISHIVTLIPRDAGPAKLEDASAGLNRIKKEIAAGAAFAEMAKKNSQDSAARDGGDLGWFSKGKMLAEFESAAFTMRPGEVAGPIRSQFGLHLITVTEREEPKPLPFEKVADSIRDKLQGESFGKKRNTWLERLRSQAYIEYH